MSTAAHGTIPELTLGWRMKTLLRSGVNIRVVQELMRHESITSTQAYTAVDESERASAVAGLDFAA